MIPDLITRLEGAGTGYQTIEHGWTLETISQFANPMPYAVFIPGPIESEPSPQLPIRQRSTESILVMTICEWDQLDARRDELYASLLGYQHTAAHTELEHTKGETSHINGSIVQWMDMFATSRWIQPG